MNAPLRRGTCPGLSAPMATGDGLLVRFSAPDAMSFAAFAGLCAAARRCGNGAIEITARGNLQVRGLTPRSAPAFAHAVAALEIATAEGLSITADPLPDAPDLLVDTPILAASLRKVIARAELALAPKVSIVLDGGGRLHLDGLSADVRLRALATPQGPRFHVSIAGDATSATSLGLLPTEAATEILVRLLGVIASHGQDSRAADILRRHATTPFCSAVEGLVEPSPMPPLRVPAEAIGSHLLRDGSIALGVALAFGHAHADDLIALAALAGEHGARALRLAPHRALLMLGLTQSNAPALAEASERQGFVARPEDPRRRIVACPGHPACASGLIAARALARELAPHLPSSYDLVHISGCSKSCAHSGPAALTVVGTERGCGIVHHGSARVAPQLYVDPDELAAELMRLDAENEGAVHA